MTQEELDDTLSRIDLQNKEFDALEKLITQKGRLDLTAVVDDDYPSVRRDYETAVLRFIEALLANGRL